MMGPWVFENPLSLIANKRECQLPSTKSQRLYCYEKLKKPNRILWQSLGVSRVKMPQDILFI